MDEIVQLLRQAKGLLERAERIAFERTHPDATALAEAGGGFDNPESPESYLRFYRFLRAVENDGLDGVDVNRQRELMRAAGYTDARASGGFFGGREPSLRRDAATDRRHLTEIGLRRVQEGRLRFGAAIDDLASPGTA
jgi:hypothetical protein